MKILLLMFLVVWQCTIAIQFESVNSTAAESNLFCGYVENKLSLGKSSQHILFAISLSSVTHIQIVEVPKYGTLYHCVDTNCTIRGERVIQYEQWKITSNTDLLDKTLLYVGNPDYSNCRIYTQSSYQLGYLTPRVDIRTDVDGENFQYIAYKSLGDHVLVQHGILVADRISAIVFYPSLYDPDIPGSFTSLIGISVTNESFITDGCNTDNYGGLYCQLKTSDIHNDIPKIKFKATDKAYRVSWTTLDKIPADDSLASLDEFACTGRQAVPYYKTFENSARVPQVTPLTQVSNETTMTITIPPVRGDILPGGFYRQFNPYSFSVFSPPCSWPYDWLYVDMTLQRQFPDDVSICATPVTTEVQFCVVDQQYDPIVQDVLLDRIDLNTPRGFAISVFDPNDNTYGEADGQISTYAFLNGTDVVGGIAFLQTGFNEGGQLYESDCITPLTPGLVYPTTGFCYIATDYHDYLVTAFVAEDNVRTGSNQGVLVIEAVRQVGACTAEGGDFYSDCTAFGQESNELYGEQPIVIAIYTTSSVPDYPVYFIQINSLPQRGTLYHCTDPSCRSKGTAVQIGDKFKGKPGVTPYMIYVGDQDYFNAQTYAIYPDPYIPMTYTPGAAAPSGLQILSQDKNGNWNKLPPTFDVDGYSLTTSFVDATGHNIGDCGNAWTDTGGCPDSFEFEVSGQSSLYHIYVNNVPSRLPRIEVSAYEENFVNIGSFFERLDLVDDRDGDAWDVEVYIFSEYAAIGLADQVDFRTGRVTPVPDDVLYIWAGKQGQNCFGDESSECIIECDDVDGLCRGMIVMIGLPSAIRRMLPFLIWKHTPFLPPRDPHVFQAPKSAWDQLKFHGQLLWEDDPNNVFYDQLYAEDFSGHQTYKTVPKTLLTLVGDQRDTEEPPYGAIRFMVQKTMGVGNPMGGGSFIPVYTNYGDRAELPGFATLYAYRFLNFQDQVCPKQQAPDSTTYYTTKPHTIYYACGEISTMAFNLVISDRILRGHIQTEEEKIAATFELVLDVITILTDLVTVVGIVTAVVGYLAIAGARVIRFTRAGLNAFGQGIRGSSMMLRVGGSTERVLSKEGSLLRRNLVKRAIRAAISRFGRQGLRFRPGKGVSSRIQGRVGRPNPGTTLSRLRPPPASAVIKAFRETKFFRAKQPKSGKPKPPDRDPIDPAPRPKSHREGTKPPVRPAKKENKKTRPPEKPPKEKGKKKDDLARKAAKKLARKQLDKNLRNGARRGFFHDLEDFIAGFLLRRLLGGAARLILVGLFDAILFIFKVVLVLAAIAFCCAWDLARDVWEDRHT